MTGRRSDVLEALRAANESMTIAEIAESLRVHPNTVRFHLGPLIDAGQVERAASPPTRPGRPAQLFRAVRGMDPTGPRQFRILAEILVDALATGADSAQRAAEAGRAWGRRLPQPDSSAPPVRRPMDDLVDLLDQLGFEPDRHPDHHPHRRGSAERRAIGLRHCPFLELASRRAGVVCPIHLGIMQGALQSWRSPLTVERLEAYVEPDLCVAHLASGSESA